jgi:hypothetical protein
MSKKLDEMSLEELWEIFPIFLVEHNDEWETWYEYEKSNILSLIPKEKIYRISHIGSTYIPTIWAKNIVDILLEIRNNEDLILVKEILLKNNWLCMSEDESRISMNKGYTEKGFSKKVFHLHIRLVGDNDELYFRDYLLENSEIAKEYERLKLSLWKKFEHNRDAYTESKGEFIKKYTEIAKKKYRNRY